MVLVPIGEGNVDAYVAFIFEEADEDGREFMATIDVRGSVLRRRQDHFYLEDGRPAASLSVDRTDRPDGSLTISLSITPRGRQVAPMLAALAEFLAGEEKTAARARRYRLSGPPELTMPEAELGRLGFLPRPGRFKYVRDPGPPNEGEFPGADAALAKGYAVTLMDEAMIAADPALFATLTELFNHAFAGQAGVTPRDEAAMRTRLTTPGCGTLLAMKGAAITGYMHFTKLAKEVLVGEYASARRHWGTGSVDLMCRRMAALVDERWDLPINGYAEVTNAPSCAAMERAGMHRAAEYPVWEYRIEAGTAMLRRPPAEAPPPYPPPQRGEGESHTVPPHGEGRNRLRPLPPQVGRDREGTEDKDTESTEKKYFSSALSVTLTFSVFSVSALFFPPKSDGRALAGPPGVLSGFAPRDQARSKRSRFITLVHAATKSAANFACESSLA